MVQKLSADSAREPEREKINPPTPGQTVEVDADETPTSGGWRDKGGALSVPKGMFKEQRAASELERGK